MPRRVALSVDRGGRGRGGLGNHFGIQVGLIGVDLDDERVFLHDASTLEERHKALERRNRGFVIDRAFLFGAVKAHDKALLGEILGPISKELLTGDAVQDTANSERLARAMAESCNPVPEGDDKIVLEIGHNNWPYPIPLVKVGSRWHFDTAAGKEEIVNRHIGKDELYAIGVCKVYVEAQRQYASMNPDASGMVKYAQRFKSTPGKKAGLFWKAEGNEAESPFGELVAEAHADGYQAKSSERHPFHGYYFKIITQQGAAAAGGKMDYMNQGNLADGFALVAYPANWGKSGIMTFIVNQDGKVYQRDFEEKTSEVAGAMTEYNPDSEWTLVKDQGVFEKGQASIAKPDAAGVTGSKRD